MSVTAATRVIMRCGRIEKTERQVSSHWLHTRLFWPSPTQATRRTGVGNSTGAFTYALARDLIAQGDE